MKHFTVPSSVRPPPKKPTPLPPGSVPFGDAPPYSELIETMFSDLIVPSGPRVMSEYSGCHRLMFALLEEAIHTYQVGIRRMDSVHLVRAGNIADEWLNDSEAQDTCSALSVCDVLHLDLPSLRKGLTAWTVREIAGEHVGMRKTRPRGYRYKAGAMSD